MNRLLAFIATLLAAALLAAADTPPKVATTVNPGYPEELTDTGLNGSALVNVLVKADGTVGTVTLKSADHPAFGAAAVGAVQGWTFQPATRDGQAIDRMVAIPFKFEPPIEQVINATLHRRVYQKLPAPALTREQFGADPVVRRLTPPGYPQALAGTGAEGDVQVRFVIGPDGSTFNPTVLGQPRKEFVVPAIASIAYTAYEPPLKDGQGVYVEATATLHFADPTLPPPAAAPAAAPAAEAKSGN